MKCEFVGELRDQSVQNPNADERVWFRSEMRVEGFAHLQPR